MQLHTRRREPKNIFHETSCDISLLRVSSRVAWLIIAVPVMSTREITRRLLREYDVADCESPTEQTIDDLLRTKRQSLERRIRELREQIDHCLASLYSLRQENQLLIQQNNHLLTVSRTDVRRG